MLTASPTGMSDRLPAACSCTSTPARSPRRNCRTCSIASLDANNGLPDLERHASPVSFELANGSVALAAAGELALPALLPVSAVLLLASNIKVLRQTLRELRERHVGLPTLFTTIIVGTLASGQFLAASLMAWMMAFWRYRHRAAQFRLRRQLLAPFSQRRRFARLLVGGLEVEVPTESLAQATASSSSKVKWSPPTAYSWAIRPWSMRA